MLYVYSFRSMCTQRLWLYIATSNLWTICSKLHTTTYNIITFQVLDQIRLVAVIRLAITLVNPNPVTHLPQRAPLTTLTRLAVVTQVIKPNQVMLPFQQTLLTLDRGWVFVWYWGLFVMLVLSEYFVLKHNFLMVIVDTVMYYQSSEAQSTQ